MSQDVSDRVFDARPYQYAGQEPFPYIIRAMEGLRPGQAFVLINTFDPRPLEAVLEARGFSYSVEQKGTEHFVVRFVENPVRGPEGLPLVDRRSEVPGAALIRLTHVVRRLRMGETFVVALSERPPDGALNVLRHASADVTEMPGDHGAWWVRVQRARPT